LESTWTCVYAVEPRPTPSEETAIAHQYRDWVGCTCVLVHEPHGPTLRHCSSASKHSCKLDRGFPLKSETVFHDCLAAARPSSTSGRVPTRRRTRLLGMIWRYRKSRLLGSVTRIRLHGVFREHKQKPSTIAPACKSVPTPIQRAAVRSVRPVKRVTCPESADDWKTAVIVAPTLARMRTQAGLAGDYVVRNTVQRNRSKSSQCHNCSLAHNDLLSLTKKHHRPFRTRLKFSGTTKHVYRATVQPTVKHLPGS
jgi:hypothetical protein